MMNGKCCCWKLCPVSFGLALGITSALAILVWTGWMMHNGIPPMMAGQMPEPTWSMAFIHAGWGLLKGFVFGFIFALLYDWMACWTKKCWSKSCGCGSANNNNMNNM